MKNGDKAALWTRKQRASRGGNYTKEGTKAEKIQAKQDIETNYLN